MPRANSQGNASLTHVRMHTRTNPHPCFYVLSTFLPPFLESNGSVSQANENKPCQPVIRDKSCQHYMSKSLGGKCSHAVYVSLCECVSGCCERDESLRVKTIHMAMTTLHLALFISCVLYSVLLHTQHTQTCTISTAPSRTKCTVQLGGLMKAERTFMGKPNAKCHHIENQCLEVGHNRLQKHQTTAEEKYMSRLLNTHAKSVHKSSYAVGYCLPVK